MVGIADDAEDVANKAEYCSTDDPVSSRRGFLMRARMIGTLYRFRVLSYDAESGKGGLEEALQRENLIKWLYQDSDDD